MGYYPIRRRLNWFKAFLIAVVGIPILVLVGYVIDNLVGNFILQKGGALPAAATNVINYTLSFTNVVYGMLAFTIIGVVVALVLAGVFGGGGGQDQY